MTAVAFPIPDEVIAVADGVKGFLRREVLPRHQRDHALLSDPRRTYGEDGRYVPAVVDHIRESPILDADMVPILGTSMANSSD